jgi:transposase
MSSVSEVYRYVVGVDTHAKVHQYAIVVAGTGKVIDQAGFATSGPGLARAVAWIGRRTGGDLEGVLVSAEGTGSYGARLAKALLDQGYRVVEAPAPKRDRGGDKNDSIDAIKAARGALPKHTDQLAEVRAGELSECLKILLAARERMSAESTRSVNAMTAILRGVDLGLDARAKLTLTQTRLVSRWRTREEDPSQALARAEVVRLATRILELRVELAANHKQLLEIVTAHAPVLLDQVGIGPFNAAIILSVWSHHGRIRDEAALARIGGVAPIEVSSGNRNEHRLSRGGDRQLNRAFHSIAKTRMRYDPDTIAYIERRAQQGLSTPRIRRCLKRYIARRTYRTLQAHTEPTQHPEPSPKAA